MQLRKPRRLALGLVAILAAMTIGAASPAFAAEAPPSPERAAETATIDLEPAPVAVEDLTAADQEFLATAADFWCTLTINYPHASTHVTGTINVTGSVSCPVTMTEIFLQIHLQKSTGASWAGTPKDFFNASWVSANASTACSSGAGSYRGRAYTEVRPPAGWSPAMQSQTKYSPYVSVGCGGSALAPAEGADTTVELLPDGSSSVSWQIGFVKDATS